MSNKNQVIFGRPYSKAAQLMATSQLATVSQKLRSLFTFKEVRPVKIHSSKEFWKLLNSGSLTSGTRIVLPERKVSDWLPRWPGVWFGECAKNRRRQARARVFGDHDKRIKKWQSEKPDLFEKFGGKSIFKTDGKGLMLEGGRGCVRLASYPSSDGHMNLCNAYKGNTLEKGIPIELPRAIYDELIDEIASVGSASGCTIEGTVRDSPREYRDAFGRGIPRGVLVVDRIQRTGADQHRPEVSVPISFVCEQDNPEVMLSFATFPASDLHGYEMACEFLREVYVGVLYGGYVLTDFDEQQSYFDDAVLSLKKITAGKVSDEKVRRSVDQAVGGSYWRKEAASISIKIGKMEATMKEEYNISNSQNISIKSSDVRQSIGQLGNEIGSNLEQLVGLIDAAKKDLSNDDYQEFLRNAKAAADEAAKDKPSKDYIDIFLGNITRKAAGIAGLADKVIPLINKIETLY
ncbi:MAG: hypothetical protein AAGA50_03535 [Pseudomonadota bacterium]